MKTFTGYITQSDQSALKHYVNTYDFRDDLGTHFQLHYAAHYQLTENCEMTQNAVPCLQLTPEKGLGKFKVQFTDGSQSIATLNRQTLTNSAGNVLAIIKDPTPWYKALVRSVLNGDPNHYQLREPQNGSVMADITLLSLKNRLPWPLSIIEAIIKLFLPKKIKPRLCVTILSSHLDSRIVLASAAILEASQGNS